MLTYHLGGTDVVPPLKSKAERIPMQRGDRVTVQTPGGGGYGDPRRRDAAARDFDRLLGYADASGTPALNDMARDITDRQLVLGIDIGGTFTDVIALNPATGEVRIVKTPTTLPNRADGLINGIRGITDDPQSIATIIHGITMAPTRSSSARVPPSGSSRRRVSRRARDRADQPPEAYGIA